MPSLACSVARCLCLGYVVSVWVSSTCSESLGAEARLLRGEGFETFSEGQRMQAAPAAQQADVYRIVRARQRHLFSCFSGLEAVSFRLSNAMLVWDAQVSYPQSNVKAGTRECCACENGACDGSDACR